MARVRGLAWVFLGLIAPVLLVSLDAGAAERARVDSFSPQGTVRDLRQVKVRFSDPIVALGDPRLADPFDIDCAPEGEGRWVDPRNWAYDFKDPLQAGQSCSFTLKPDLKTLAGSPVRAGKPFTFDSGGPVARWAFPNDGHRHIDENQVFLLAFDGEPDADSLSAKSWCRIADMRERVPLDILGDADRARILGQDFDYDYRLAQMLRGLGLPYDEHHKLLDDHRVVAARCHRALPPGAKVALVFDDGLKAATGLATDRAYQLEFAVRPHFRADFTCKRVNADAACLPFVPMVLNFNSPLPTDQAMAIRLVGPDGKEISPTPPEPVGVPQTYEVRFDGPFPELTRYRLVLPEGLSDDAGRPLINADRFPLEVGTDGYPPLVKFPGTFGILERGEGGVLPVTLRGVEPDLAARRLNAVDGRVSGRGLRLADDDHAIAQWLRRVEWAERRRFANVKDKHGNTRLREETGRKSLLAAVPAAETTNFLLPRQEQGRTTEVVGIPLKEPGFHVVELASPLLGQALLDEPVTRYVATAALVTNMAVHVHWGRESSLVWVTSLDSAKPLAGARVTVTDYCTGKHLWSGTTDGEGRAMIEGFLPPPRGYTSCSRWSTSPLMISARLDGDMSFTLTDWGNGIKPWDFDLRVGHESQIDIASTVLDRALFRAGETVHMKHFLRRHTRWGLEAPEQFKPTRNVEIRHRGSDKKYEFSVAFDAGGIGQSTWEIPKDAALGFYGVSVQSDDGEMRPTGTFRVEEFRLPTMKATIQGPATPQVNVGEVPVDLFLEYLSGGGAGGAPVKLRAQVEPRWPRFDNYRAFSFNAEEIQAGLHDLDRPSSAASTRRSRLIPLSLDDKGAARVTIPDLPALTSPADLAVEMEYEDANGEILSVARRIPLWHADVLLGIRLDDWVASRDKLKFQVIALDTKGQPVAGAKVRVDAFHRLRYSYRKRLIGGFYSYSDSQEVRPLDAKCKGTSDERGLVHCELAPDVSGDVVLRASTTDAAGNQSLSTRSVWVIGEDDWWFSGTDSDRMDLLPEKPEYETGDVARFQVRMPFREATALVTINREGVMDSFVTHLSGKEPVIAVPIKDTHAPNVFVSVLALRGRITGDRPDLPDGGMPTALVDLRKPAFRLGLAEVRVGWKPHRLDVAVTPERDQYQTREVVRVRFKVARADGGALPAGAELAVAAVDEALLQLRPNDSWKLLDAMMNERGLEVFTATAQTQVIGKRHYGRKAVAAGGGGGASGLQARELFETLLLWEGRVKLDANGEASLEIPLNDSLTTFRIAAIANAGTNYYGTGSTTVLSTQDLIIHAGLPEVVREGDRFDALVTLRNTSDRPLTVAAEAAVTGGAGLEPREATIPPGQAQRVGWTVEVPRDLKSLDWEILARATGGDGVSDHLRISQTVIPAVPVRTLQATLTQVSGKASIPAERPADALPGRGGLRLLLQSSLAGSLDGVIDYMRQYPYGCLEQKVSKAVALRDVVHWDRIAASMPLYLDGDGLMKYFPSSRLVGSDVLTSYVMSIAPEAGWQLPDNVRERALGGLTLFATGKIHRFTGYRAADLTIRRLAAIAALSRHGRANAQMLDALDITPDLWPTSAVLDWITVLQRVKDVPDKTPRMEQAFHILRSRMELHGTVLNFSTERSDYLWWLMGNADVNANRALIAMMAEGGWQQDMPLMMRGAIGRMQRGHWRTTTANAWGVLAVEKFVASFEKTPVAGTTEARYAQDTTTTQWNGADKVDPIDFSWGDGQLDLTLTHRGEGKPWAMVRARAAVPLKEPLFTGYRIQRTITPIEQRTDGVWSRGDVARVKLEIEAGSDMTWVVVEDPVPAGASILGSGLGGDSARLVSDQQWNEGAWPAFQERRFDSYRTFYRYVPQGTFSLEYTIRLNNPGTFQLPPTRVEAMYAPEMMGLLPIAPLEVKAVE